MKLWITKNSEIPMRVQLVTQIKLGIASGDLRVGEKLPSRQEISRRFGVHANTVSNAYHELAENKLVEFRKGSGFYVNEIDSDTLDEKPELDTLITKFFLSAQYFGFSNEEIKTAVERRISSKPPKSFVVVEPEKPLRRILVEEIRQATNAKVFGMSFEDFENEHSHINANFVALSDEKTKIDPVLKADETCLYLKIGSVPSSMKDQTRPDEDSLIAVVSGWGKFLWMAKTILVAAKIHSDSIIVRLTDEDDWKRGLNNVSILICDSLTAREFPNNKMIKVFQVIAEESLKEVQKSIDRNSQ